MHPYAPLLAAAVALLAACGDPTGPDLSGDAGADASPDTPVTRPQMDPVSLNGGR
jgi:hypothetical protein